MLTFSNTNEVSVIIMSFFLASRHCGDAENDNTTATCDDSLSSQYKNDLARFYPFKVFGPSALKKVEHPLLVMVKMSVYIQLFPLLCFVLLLD